MVDWREKRNGMSNMRLTRGLVQARCPEMKAKDKLTSSVSLTRGGVRKLLKERAIDRESDGFDLYHAVCGLWYHFH
jgi:hypothetical protein